LYENIIKRADLAYAEIYLFGAVIGRGREEERETERGGKVKVKMKVEKEIDITKSDFEDYERVKESGETNMFDIKTVEELSDNLTTEKIKAIIYNYAALKEKFKSVVK
jgi:hypothetical protein